jgi:hypothetical protein
MNATSESKVQSSIRKKISEFPSGCVPIATLGGIFRAEYSGPLTKGIAGLTLSALSPLTESVPSHQHITNRPTVKKC